MQQRIGVYFFLRLFGLNGGNFHQFEIINDTICTLAAQHQRKVNCCDGSIGRQGSGMLAASEANGAILFYKRELHSNLGAVTCHHSCGKFHSGSGGPVAV